MKEIFNCPNCGMPMEGNRCEYCGTTFHDFTDLNIGDFSYIRLKSGDQNILCKVFIPSFKSEAFMYDWSDVYFNGRSPNHFIKPRTEYRITLEMIAVLNDKGTVFEVETR